MTKLLLPVDGSPSSLRAARWAVRHVAGSPGAKVLLLNVQLPVLAMDVSPHVTAGMVHQLHERAGREAEGNSGKISFGGLARQLGMPD